MITAAYGVAMAQYNSWMNERLYALCAELPDAERRADRAPVTPADNGGSLPR